MKKVFIILAGIITILVVTIFFIVNNNQDKNNEVVETTKEENIEKNKEDKEIEPISTVVVDIKGMVANPGVYEVENTARVNDVISLAGGLLENADTSSINLAKTVQDEMTIIIYSSEEALEKYKKEVCICDCSYIENDACIKEENEDILIDINTCTVDDLLAINGIGKAKAEAIINYRNEHGNFNSIDEVKNVSGIGDALFEKIKAYIKV